MPRFCARLWDRVTAMDPVVPYCGHNREHRLFTLQSRSQICVQSDARCYTVRSDLIDPYSTIQRTRAPEVRCTASAVVEGRVSARTMEDREVGDVDTKSKSQPDIYLDVPGDTLVVSHGAHS